MRDLIDHILDRYSIPLAVVALCLVTSPNTAIASTGGLALLVLMFSSREQSE